MYYGKGTVVFLDGTFEKASQAQTDLFSQTLHYGHGVIEGMRSYSTPLGPHIFKAKEHYERMLEGADRLGLKIKFNLDELIHFSYQLLEENKNLTNAYIRPMVYVGASMPLITSKEAHVFIAAWKWKSYFENDLLNLKLSSIERPNPKSTLVDYKLAGHYTNYIFATTEARKEGYDEALLKDMNGYVAQASASNFFYQKDGKLFTAPKGHILPGITRKVVFDLAKELDIEVFEKNSTPEEVMQADSAFLTSAALEITGINSINKRAFDIAWEDSLGHQLQLKYHQIVQQSEYDSYSII
ncbi:MAG: aminotransferase class IV [Flammeovirgaceae bacterium]